MSLSIPLHGRYLLLNAGIIHTLPTRGFRMTKEQGEKQCHKGHFYGAAGANLFEKGSPSLVYQQNMKKFVLIKLEGNKENRIKVRLLKTHIDVGIIKPECVPPVIGVWIWRHLKTLIWSNCKYWIW